MKKLIISWLIGILAIFGSIIPFVLANFRQYRMELMQPQTISEPKINLFLIILILVIYCWYEDKKPKRKSR